MNYRHNQAQKPKKRVLNYILFVIYFTLAPLVGYYYGNMTGYLDGVETVKTTKEKVRRDADTKIHQAENDRDAWREAYERATCNEATSIYDIRQSRC